MTPTVSVISGIYNCADTLPEAVESILAQTVTDWEWILCDDASIDDTYTVAKEYADKYPGKFILIRNDKNMGLNYTLNRCLEHTKGQYIARMDGDDLCSPDRFEKELAALMAQPDMALVSTAMTYFDETGTWGRNNPKPQPQKVDFLYGAIVKCAFGVDLQYQKIAIIFAFFSDKFIIIEWKLKCFNAHNTCIVKPVYPIPFGWIVGMMRHIFSTF